MLTSITTAISATNKKKAHLSCDGYSIDCRQAKTVPHCLNKLYEHGGEPSIAELLSALEEILKYFDGIYLLIDAIGESMPGDDLLKILRDLVPDHCFKKIQLLAISRQYIDIEIVMKPISTEISMMNPLLDEDIRQYVRSKLATNQKFERWPETLVEEVLEALSIKAKGM